MLARIVQNSFHRLTSLLRNPTTFAIEKNKRYFNSTTDNFLIWVGQYSCDFSHCGIKQTGPTGGNGWFLSPILWTPSKHILFIYLQCLSLVRPSVQTIIMGNNKSINDEEKWNWRLGIIMSTWDDYASLKKTAKKIPMLITPLSLGCPATYLMVTLSQVWNDWDSSC